MPGQLGAEGGRSEQPHLGEVPPPGNRRRMGRGPVAVDQVVDQLHHVVGEGVRTLFAGTPEGAGGDLVGAGGPAEAEVDPSRDGGPRGWRTARRSPVGSGWGASRRRRRPGGWWSRRPDGRSVRPAPNWPPWASRGARPPTAGGSPAARPREPGGWCRPARRPAWNRPHGGQVQNGKGGHARVNTGPGGTFPARCPPGRLACQVAVAVSDSMRARVFSMLARV